MRTTPSRIPLFTSSSSSLCLLFFLLLVSVPAQAGTPIPIVADPYQALHGVRLLPKIPLDPHALALPAPVRDLLQVRTEELLARAEQSPLLSRATGANGLSAALDDLRRELAESREMLDRGRVLGAFQKAQVVGLVMDFFRHLIETTLRAAIEAKRSNTRFPPPLETSGSSRARVAAFAARLDAMRPTTVPAVLALAGARAAVIDCQSSIDGLRRGNNKFEEVIEKSLPAADPDKRAFIVRVLLAAFMDMIVDATLKQAEIELALAPLDDIDPALSAHLDPAWLKRLTRLYADAAAVNLNILAGRGERVRPSPVDAVQQIFGEFAALSLVGRIEYLQRADDAGLDPSIPWSRFATAFSAYVDSLVMLADQDRRIAAAGEGTNDDPARASEELDRQMLKEELRARRAAAQAQAMLGGVPVVVAMRYQEGAQLAKGDRDDRENAIHSFITAAAQADLAVALGADIDSTRAGPDASSDGEGPSFAECTDNLYDSQGGLVSRAERWAARNHPQIDRADVSDMINEAILRACLDAEDRLSDLQPFFWRVLKNLVANYYRATLTLERNAPRLMDRCTPPSTEDELVRREEADLLHRAMCALDDDEQRVLRIWSESKKHKDVAKALGISEDASRKRVTRAFERLREEFKRLGGFSRWHIDLLRRHAVLLHGVPFRAPDPPRNTDSCTSNYKPLQVF